MTSGSDCWSLHNAHALGGVGSKKTSVLETNDKRAFTLSGCQHVELWGTIWGACRLFFLCAKRGKRNRGSP
jgi:hypothetical protein